MQYHDSHGEPSSTLRAFEVCNEGDGEEIITGRSGIPVVFQTWGGRVELMTIARVFQENGSQFYSAGAL